MVLFKTIRKYIKLNKTNLNNKSMIIVFLGKNRFSPVLCRFIYTKISLSEKIDTKAVTRKEPFQSVLIYTIGNSLHPLDVNKVHKWQLLSFFMRGRPIFNIQIYNYW